MPDRSASATRCIGLARLLIQLGYNAIVVGKFPDNTESKVIVHNMIVDGVKCINIEHPMLGINFRSYVISAESILNIINSIGVNKIYAVIAYNYPPRGGFYMTRACHSLGIPVVLDCTEWYGWEGNKIMRNIMRMIGTSVRMRLLTRYAKNVICISRFIESKMSNCHSVLLPLVVDMSSGKWASHLQKNPIVNQTTHLTYSGSPGVGMHKDLLPIIIESLHVLYLDGCKFIFKIAGLTREQYLEVIPSHQRMLEDMQEKVMFLGRIFHDDALELVTNSDFTVFFRLSNRVSNAGFPTKFVESYSLGIPVITNDTSDIGYYLNDGINGFIIKDISKDSVIKILRKAVELNSDIVLNMKSCCLHKNPFDISNWLEPMKIFMQNLKVPNV